MESNWKKFVLSEGTRIAFSFLFNAEGSKRRIRGEDEGRRKGGKKKKNPATQKKETVYTHITFLHGKWGRKGGKRERGKRKEKGENRSKEKYDLLNITCTMAHAPLEEREVEDEGKREGEGKKGGERGGKRRKERAAT